jgi:hypothetical protein
MAHAEKTVSRAPDAGAEMLLRGSVIRLRRKCGKATCHCRKGEPHMTWALSYSVKGKTQILTLRREDLPPVRRALARYRHAAGELEKKVQRDVERLRSVIHQGRTDGKERRQ